jgi:6-phosphofructokinase 2
MEDLQKSIMTLTLNPSMDVSASVERVVPERKLRCRHRRVDPGGGGINVSRAIRKLGGESTALYLAGGPDGESLERLLNEEGVENIRLTTIGETRGNLIIREESAEQQFRFGMPGPEVRASEWKECLERVASLNPFPDFFVVSGSLPEGVPAGFYARLAEIVKEANGKLIVDTSDDALRAAAEAGAYLLKPNMRELRQLAEGDITDDDSLVAAAEAVRRNHHVEAVVVSLGAGGALLVASELRQQLPSPTVPIRSKVGAGDSMVAGIVVALARRKSLLEATRFGVAAGAAAVMTPGTELCRRADVEAICRRTSQQEHRESRFEPETLGGEQ